MISYAMIATGLNFASEFLKGSNEAHQYKMAGANYEQQAQLYRRNAHISRLKGSLNENNIRSQKRAYMAQANASAGEVGMAESPTMATALATTSASYEQNILNRRYEVETEAENYLYQARIADENARQMKKKSRHSFRNSLIKGISSGLNSYVSYKF
jgi:hypothetical protein